MLKTIQSIFSDLQEKYVFFGLGVNAFNRLGPENFIPNYRLISLRNPLENKLIGKDLEIFSLEKGMGSRHINAPRNSNTLVKDKRTQEYIKSFKDRQPVFLVYKPFLSMQKICQQNRWVLCANPYRFGKKLFENKIVFRKILEGLKLPVPPGEIVKNPKDLAKRLNQLKEKYGSPLVIQHPARGGGRGTFFINNKDELKQILPNLEDELLVLKFIQGPSPSITGCVTPWGICYTYPQYQILDMPECYHLEAKAGNGLWCGHDWTFSRFDEKTLTTIYQAVTKVGEYLKTKNYKGIFGLDFVQDEKSGNVYIGECNPRLLGSFPIITMVQIKNREVPILALHILSFLELQEKHHDIMRHIFENLLALMKKEKIGAQLILHNREACWARNQKKVKPGIYRLKKDEIAFLREGYRLEELREKEEFLLSDGLPHKFSPFSPNRRIMRLVTLNQVLEGYQTLTPWAHQAAEAAYRALALKQVRFYHIKKFFKPSFMAKG